MAKRRGRAAAAVALLLIAAMAVPALSRIASSGAIGFSHTYSNPSFFNWAGVPGPFGDLPSMDCHVASVTDGSWWGGWGGAQVDRLGDGNWVELSECAVVDGAAAIRVNSRSTLVLEDPPVDPTRAPAQGDPSECNAELLPGTRVWTTGPGDPSYDWAPPEVWTPTVIVWPDTVTPDPFEYVIDHGELTGVTRVINHPFASGVVLARGTSWDPTVPDMPLLPGESVQFMPDGTVGPPCEVLVRGLGDAIAPPEDPAEVSFEVWNLTGSPLTFVIVAEATEDWGLDVSDPMPTVAPMSFQVVTVSTLLPPDPGLFNNMVTLRAETAPLLRGPADADWDAAFIEVDMATAVAERPARSALWLGQCQPNPFNPTTWIPYDLPALSRVRLDVHDTTGRLVATLVDAVQTGGGHAAVWDGRDARGEPVASGVYFYRLTVAGHESLVKKMVLLK